MRILMLFKDIHMSAYAQCAYHKLQNVQIARTYDKYTFINSFVCIYAKKNKMKTALLSNMFCIAKMNKE